MGNDELTEQEADFLQSLSLLCERFEAANVPPERLQLLLCTTAIAHARLTGKDLSQLWDEALAFVEQSLET